MTRTPVVAVGWKAESVLRLFVCYLTASLPPLLEIYISGCFLVDITFIHACETTLHSYGKQEEISLNGCWLCLPLQTRLYILTRNPYLSSPFNPRSLYFLWWNWTLLQIMPEILVVPFPPSFCQNIHCIQPCLQTTSTVTISNQWGGQSGHIFSC